MDAAAEETHSLGVVCPEPGTVELREVPLGALKPSEVRVAATVTAISPGTERAWFLAEEGAPVRFPYRPGYCHVGRVAAIGSAVRGLAIGDRVLSLSPHAAVVHVDAGRLIPVPAGVSDEDAAMAPLAAISLQGVRKAEIELGSATAVLGAGLIGLLAMKLARMAGAYPLVAADLSAHRRRIALRNGATHAVDTAALAALAQSVERSTAPDPGFDVVIDATGHPGAVPTAIEVCGSSARLVLLGSTRGRADGIDVYQVHYKGIRIIGAHNRNRPERSSQPGRWTWRDDVTLILRLVRDGLLSFEGLVSDRVRPTDVPAVFERLRARDETLLGCMIHWRSA
ncbi:MAG TPA: zinc-binding alcohol dehydrogenase [Limnochordia bacterium]